MILLISFLPRQTSYTFSLLQTVHVSNFPVHTQQAHQPLTLQNIKVNIKLNYLNFKQQ